VSPSNQDCGKTDVAAIRIHRWVRRNLITPLAIQMAEPKQVGESPAFSVADALKNPQRILLVPDSRPGGLFIGASKFWAIRERYPDASLDLLAHRKKDYIAAEIPFIDKVILYDNFLLPLGPRRREVITALRSRDYDLAFCFCTDEDFCPTYFCYKSGAHVRVGFRKDDTPFFNIRIVPGETPAYEPDRLSLLLDLLGIPEAREGVSWTVSEEGAKKIRDRFLVGGHTDDRYVGIDVSAAPNEGLSVKQWLAIAQAAANRARVLIFFNYQERKEANQIKEALGQKALMFQNEDLPRQVVLIGLCDQVVAANTDIFHLAVAMGRPVIGLFDEEQARRWVPRDRPNVDLCVLSDLRSMGVSELDSQFREKLSPRSPVTGSTEFAEP